MSVFGADARQPDAGLRDRLKVSFKGRSQIEIGGPFVGIEMHDGSPLLNRLNFYYPVATSMDASTDYWKRGQSRVMSIGLKAGDKPREWITPEPFDYELTPYWALFRSTDSEKTLTIGYEFCKNKPAMVAVIELINTSSETAVFEIYTHLEASVKTSHTSALQSSAWTEFDGTGSAIYVNFESTETAHSRIFAANASQPPSGFSADGEITGPPGTAENLWMKTGELSGAVIDKSEKKRPAAAFVYKKSLAPGEKMTVTQIIGSAKPGEEKELVKYLLENHLRETRLYEQYVLEKVYGEGIIETGDDSLDRTAAWAKAVLAVNAHYLDGEIVPMPCPVEYNFFFTHDTLVTDLAAVNFAPGRVKKDLDYIAKHAAPGADNVILHAYYWKDNRYVTEFAGADNWNHFWHVITAASYLRHSNDTETVKRLYPLLAKSIKQMLTNKKDDGLIWAYRPDWWDIGSSFGPRSYMTILAVRALREFAFISSALGGGARELARYEAEAQNMQERLNAVLWDDELNYFVNYYGDGAKDAHLYTGSLLAAHFNLTDDSRKKAMVETARKNLLDEKTGVYNAYPMDFHKLGDYLKFNGPEAGEPFYYLNGGIWPNGNAWYALALISAGKKAEALRFIKTVMTLDGIVDGPNGQYAMYECRNGDRQNPSVYGTVDKPQFLWAGGWYLYALYSLLGVRENVWNISFEPWLAEGMKHSKYTLFAAGAPVIVETAGWGAYIKTIKYDGALYPSAVIPERLRLKEKIGITLGFPEIPYISRAGSALVSGRFDPAAAKLTFELRAFPGHKTQTEIISPLEAKAVFVNGKNLESWKQRRINGVYLMDVVFSHQTETAAVAVRF
ncbi:MAG: hypothetical protein KKH28_08205 [Elusimicrobia bacterium]|nr:hypothetical protein [Elusimicrobiota bacterium]